MHGKRTATYGWPMRYGFETDLDKIEYVSRDAKYKILDALDDSRATDYRLFRPVVVRIKESNTGLEKAGGSQ